MKYCVKCGLPETYAKIRLDGSQVCNYCRFFEEHERELMDYGALSAQFAREIERAKQTARKNHARYDCIVGLSGGKDGAYITYQLKHTYGMRVLTYTLNNGFSTDFGRDNIALLADKLDVDHIRVTVNETQLRRYYSVCMKLMHNFCSVCFHMCHYYGYLLAQQNGIPLIVNGRTRSQILQSADDTKGLEPFEISRTLEDFEYQMYGKLVERSVKSGKIDYLKDAEVTALSYFMYHPVTDEEKMAFLEKHVGWKRPETTVPHPDCWAHPVAEKCSIEKCGYPVRAGELAEMVREGLLTRGQAAAECKADRAQFAEIDEEVEARFYERIRMRRAGTKGQDA